MERNAYVDNARALLIFLVVFGHLIQPFIKDSVGMHTLYTWIYFFHMPAFIFLSGYFARGSGDKGYIWNLVKKLIMPYMIFQALYTGFYFLIGKSDWQASLFYPQWSLWFLFSLFCWHLLLILYKNLKPSHGIGLAIFVGLIAGYIGGIGHTFSLSRTLVFFPFFLIGYWVTKEHLQLVKSKTVKFTGLLILAVMVLLIYYLPEINTGWLLASKPYSALGAGWEGGLIRLGVYVASTLMAISILAWVPTERIQGVTYLGERTLYVYLLHGFFIQYFRQVELFSVDGPIDVIGLVAISAGLVYLLSSSVVIGIFQPLIEGKMTRWREKIS